MNCATKLAMGLVLLTAGLAGAQTSKPPSLTVSLKNAQGEEIGTALLVPLDTAVRVSILAHGLPIGLHGMHFHEVGRCDPPDFKSAGAHFNPEHKKHGLERGRSGPHAGDLPNLAVNGEGRAEAHFINSHVRLEPGFRGSLLDEDGTALVIHAGPDDQRTDPAGDSGDRIACGVISSETPSIPNALEKTNEQVGP